MKPERRKQFGWRIYSLGKFEVLVGTLRRPKIRSTECLLNSTWITRPEMARMLREFRATN
jgi:hypothetical protein